MVVSYVRDKCEVEPGDDRVSTLKMRLMWLRWTFCWLGSLFPYTGVLSLVF